MDFKNITKKSVQQYKILDVYDDDFAVDFSTVEVDRPKEKNKGYEFKESDFKTYSNEIIY